MASSVGVADGAQAASTSENTNIVLKTNHRILLDFISFFLLKLTKYWMFG
jgi:hypothetical protein